MTTETRTRICLPGDEFALALVGQSTFLETFAGILRGQDIILHCATAHAVALYRQWLTDPDYRLWLVETVHGDAPVGYMVAARASLPLPDLSSDDLEIKRIYLLGRFRGGGTGRKLVEEALRYAQACGASRLLLGVYARNESAIGFYGRVGFRSIGHRKFKVGEQSYDDDIMALPVSRPQT